MFLKKKIFLLATAFFLTGTSSSANFLEERRRLEIMFEDLKIFCQFSPERTFSNSSLSFWQIENFHQNFVQYSRNLAVAYERDDGKAIEHVMSEIHLKLGQIASFSPELPHYRDIRSCYHGIFRQFTSDGIILYPKRPDLVEIGKAVHFVTPFDLDPDMDKRLFGVSLRELANKLVFYLGHKDPDQQKLTQRLSRLSESDARFMEGNEDSAYEIYFEVNDEVAQWENP